MFEKNNRIKHLLKRNFSIGILLFLSMLFCERTQSFICERARKVAKNSLTLKINRLEKSQTTPLKFDSDPK